MNLVILLYLLIGLALYVYFIKKLGVSKLAKNRFVKSISPRMSVLLKILIPTLIFAFFRGHSTIFVLSGICIAVKLLLDGRESFAFIVFGLIAAFQFPYALFALLAILCKKTIKSLMIFDITLIITSYLPWVFIMESPLSPFRVFGQLNINYYETYV